MDLSLADIKIDKRPTGRGRALFQRRCFYYKKDIWYRPLTPNNLDSKGTSSKYCFRERRASESDNKHVIYFDLIRRTLHIEQAGEEGEGREEEEEKSNKEGDLYGGGSLLSHVIP